jgi:hypothetical protein
MAGTFAHRAENTATRAVADMPRRETITERAAAEWRSDAARRGDVITRYPENRDC